MAIKLVTLAVDSPGTSTGSCRVVEAGAVDTADVRYLAMRCLRGKKKISRGRIGIGSALLGAGAGWVVGRLGK